MNKIAGQYVLLSYPDFSKIFIIHADTRKMQLGRVIDGKWETICLLLSQVNPHTNKSYKYSKKTVDYSGNLKIFAHPYIRVSDHKYKRHLIYENLTTEKMPR